VVCHAGVRHQNSPLKLQGFIFCYLSLDTSVRWGQTIEKAGGIHSGSGDAQLKLRAVGGGDVHELVEFAPGDSSRRLRGMVEGLNELPRLVKSEGRGVSTV
jgi:hypothetical protein